MKKPASTPSGLKLYAAPPEELAQDLPLLAEQLTATSYEGEAVGSRQTATLLLFAQDGTFRAVLRDRQEARCLWVSSPTFDDLFHVLEAALGDPAAVWRDDRVSGAEQAKRQKPAK